MKLKDYFVFQPVFHEWLDSGQQRFEVGARGCESIEATPSGVLVTMLPDGRTESRALLFTGPGMGSAMTEAESKQWADYFKGLKLERAAEAKDRANRPPPPETVMEVP
jgi:hypothetical protein